MALAGIVTATVAVTLVGAVGATAFALPIIALAVAAVSGRRSAKRSRDAFPDRAAWRDAERSAVARAWLPLRRSQPAG